MDSVRWSKHDVGGTVQINGYSVVRCWHVVRMWISIAILRKKNQKRVNTVSKKQKNQLEPVSALIYVLHILAGAAAAT